MKPAPFAYVRPRTVAEALESLTAAEALVIAGGQSLVPMLHMRLLRPEVLVDINRVEELDRIEARGDGVAIGALTRYATVESSALVAERLPLLQEAIRYVGDRQVRNRGTIGGSLAQADPVGEVPLVCLALGAVVVLRSSGGVREVPLDEFLFGPYTTAREPNELLVEVRFPAAPGAFSFFEVGRRHNDFAVVAVATLGDPVPGSGWRDLRVAIAGGDYRPLLVGLGESTLDEPAIDRAVAACDAVLDPPDDIRASAEYRRHLIAVHVARLLRRLRDESGGGRG